MFHTKTINVKTTSCSLDSFNSTPAPNPDGIGNCLRQPGPIRNHPNVYHHNLHPLIILSVPWPILLPWQRQWGCRPSRRCHGFCITIVIILSYRDKSCSLIGTHSSGPFYRDIQILLIYRDCAKTHANPDTDGNYPYHRAVRLSNNLVLLFITMRLVIIRKTMCFVP